MAEITAEMIVQTKKAFLGNDLESADKVMELEDIVNHLQDAITKYLSSIFSIETVTEHQARTISGLLHVASDVEHIGDNCKNITEFAIEKIENSYEFSDTAYAEIYQCFDHGSKMVSNAIKALQDPGNTDLAYVIKDQEVELDTLEETLREHHMERLNTRKCSPEFTVIYTDVIHNIERIGDSCENIANVVMDKINLKVDAE